MARGPTLRPGHRWQPGVWRQPRRVAGRLRWRWPRLGASPWTVHWRRAALLALVVSGVALAGYWLYHSPLLSVREVTVEGADRLSPEVVRNTAGIEGESIIRPDFKGARERLLALPLVKEASVSRDWPNGARISIVERVPWGLWQVGERRFVVDEEGFVLDAPAPEGAPVIVQTDGPAPGGRVDPGAVAVVRLLVPTSVQTLGRSVVALEFSQTSGLSAVLSGGAGPDVRVTFGDAQGYEFKVAALFAVLRQAQEEGRSLSKVDLRFGDRVAVQ